MEKKSAPQTVSRSASNPVSTAKPNTPPAAAPDAALSLRPDAGSDTEQRFIDIEMALSDLERTVEDLNDVIIRQGHRFPAKAEPIPDRSPAQCAKHCQTAGRRNSAAALLIQRKHYRRKAQQTQNPKRPVYLI